MLYNIAISYCNISGLVLPLLYQQVHVTSYNIIIIVLDTSLEAHCQVVGLIDLSMYHAWASFQLFSDSSP